MATYDNPRISGDSTRMTTTSYSHKMHIFPDLPPVGGYGAGDASQQEALSLALSEEEKQSIKEEAGHVLRNISDGALQQELLQACESVQLVATDTGKLLKDRYSDIVSASPRKEALNHSMDDMRELIKKMDPARAGSLGLITRLLSRNPIALRIKKIHQEYESAEKKVQAIDNGLQKGGEALLQDSKDLLSLYDSLTAQQKEVAKRILLLEEVLGGLGKGEGVSRNFVHSLTLALQDMKLMYVANRQFQDSIDMVVNNNTALHQSVKRVRSMAINVARTGLALQSALLQQKRTVDAVDGVKRFMGETMSANAQLLRDNSVAIAEVANSPVLSLDRIKEHHRLLQETFVELDNVKARLSKETAEAMRGIDLTVRELASLPPLSHDRE